MSSEKVVAGWSEARLRGLSVADRHKLWKNARASASADGVELTQMIEAIGLPFSDDACLTLDDPITLKMWEIINSPSGKAACLDATKSGLPAIAGVDPMLNEALGVDYRSGNMATVTAGSLVGEFMRSQEYSHGGQRALPVGCVAKSGAFWVKR